MIDLLMLVAGLSIPALAAMYCTFIHERRREFAELELWTKYGDGRELGAGIIDVKGFYPETPEDVRRRIHRVLQVCPADKLTVNPDCGFGWSPRDMSNQKLRALAAGAALARAELTGRR